MLGFIIGLIVGGFFGITLTCLCVAANGMEDI